MEYRAARLEARVGFEPTNGGFADLSLRPLGYRAEANEYSETGIDLSGPPGGNPSISISNRIPLQPDEASHRSRFHVAPASRRRFFRKPSPSFTSTTHRS